MNRIFELLLLSYGNNWISVSLENLPFWKFLTNDQNIIFRSINRGTQWSIVKLQVDDMHLGRRPQSESSSVSSPVSATDASAKLITDSSPTNDRKRSRCDRNSINFALLLITALLDSVGFSAYCTFVAEFVAAVAGPHAVTTLMSITGTFLPHDLP